MKIIILEGIATSGKTSVINKLSEYFFDKEISYAVIGENDTLMPLLDNTDRQASIDLLKKAIDGALKKKKDVVIFDRLFFTHVFRTKSALEDFKEIEDMVKDQALLVLLKIDEDMIQERIGLARKHRDKEWNDFVDKKGSENEIYQYYARQQRFLLDLIDKTSLKHRIYNTTNMDFDGVAKDIISFF